MSQDTEELRGLRQRVLDLERENAELRRPRVVRQIVRRPGFTSPTRPELDAVCKVVLAAFPFLMPDNAARRASFDDEYIASFIALSFMRRQEPLQTRYANSLCTDAPARSSNVSTIPSAI